MMPVPSTSLHPALSTKAKNQLYDRVVVLARFLAKQGSEKVGGFAVRACRVIDQTDAGARIQIDPAAPIPSNFNLLLSRGIGAGRPARLKWRQGAHVGLAFCEAR